MITELVTSIVESLDDNCTITMTTEQTPSYKEDCVKLEAPEKASKWTLR